MTDTTNTENTTQEALEGTSEAVEAPEGVEGQGKTTEAPETFSREYVQGLREEAKSHRLAAERVPALEAQARGLAVKYASSGILYYPELMEWSDDLAGEDGLPDLDKIRARAEDMVRVAPYLGKPKGDVGQGQHSESPAAVSLSELLRLW